MPPRKKSGQFTWWKEARFGVFFHWGSYSVYGRAEWAMNQERWPFDEYKKFADMFKPKKDWADEWMELIKRAGAKYAVLTTKHCEGYCLFKTKSTDYSAPNTGPGRDLVAEYVDACRKAGVKIGFYFTPWDWRFSWDPLWTGPKNKMTKEYRTCMNIQIEELCKNYGPIDLWWWDGVPPDVKNVIARMREWQPKMIINDRCGLKLDCGSAEKKLTFSDDPNHAWEVCTTSCKHWGYYADEATCQWMSLAESIHWLVSTASHASNLLYNIGPRADGTIPPKAKTLFEGMGDWLRKNGESIYGVGPSSITGGACAATTAKGNTVYLHVLHWAQPEIVVLSPKLKVTSAKLLLTGKKLGVRQEGERVIISGLPRKAPDPIDTVIELKTNP